MEKRRLKSVKNKVSRYFGFKFDHRRKISNYEDVCNSISLGPGFELVCKCLQLNSDILRGHIVDHVLHLIYEDVIAISLEEKVLLRKFGHLWSDENDDDEDSFAGIASEYFDNPEDFIEYFSLNFLCDLFDVSISGDTGSNVTRNKLRTAEISLSNRMFPEIPVDYSLKEKYKESSEDIEFSHDATDYAWHRYSRISGSLYRILRKKLNEGEMTLTRQPHFIINQRENKDDSKAFFQNALQKTKWFVEALDQQSADHPSYMNCCYLKKIQICCS